MADEENPQQPVQQPVASIPLLSVLLEQKEAIRLFLILTLASMAIARAMELFLAYFSPPMQVLIIVCLLVGVLLLFEAVLQWAMRVKDRIERTSGVSLAVRSTNIEFATITPHRDADSLRRREHVKSAKVVDVVQPSTSYKPIARIYSSQPIALQQLHANLVDTSC